MPTPAPELNAGTVAMLNEELSAMRAMEVTTKTAMDGILEAASWLTSDWSYAYRHHQEDPDHVFAGLPKLSEATAEFPQVLEQRIELSTRATQFAQDVTDAITRKSDGSRVKGSINPSKAKYSNSPGEMEYVGDDPDIPALFVRISGAKLGRVVGVKYYNLSHGYRTPEQIATSWDINDGLDPLQAIVWPVVSEHTRIMGRHPVGHGILLAEAKVVLFEGNKKGFELPEPDDYTPPRD